MNPNRNSSESRRKGIPVYVLPETIDVLVHHFERLDQYVAHILLLELCYGKMWESKMECESYMLNCTHGMPRGVHMPQVAQCGHSLCVGMLHLTSLPSFSLACSGVSSLVGTPSASACFT